MPTAGRAFCAVLSPGRPEASSDGMKARAAFFGGALQGRSEAAGRGRPCCRRGPRCSALARAGGTAMLRQALFAEYPAFFLCFRCTLRFFLGGGSTLRGAFRTGAFAVRLQRSFCSGKPGAFIRRLLPGKGHPRRSLFFRHTCLAACGNRWAFMKASRGFNPESPRPFPGGGFLSAHGRYGTCCGVMPSRRFRDFPRPCAVLLRQEREEGEYLHRFSGARRAAGRIFLCLPRQRPR